MVIFLKKAKGKTVCPGIISEYGGKVAKAFIAKFLFEIDAFATNIWKI